MLDLVISIMGTNGDSLSALVVLLIAHVALALVT